MALSTDEKLDKLLRAVEKRVVAPIAPVLPVAPVAPVLPILNSGDHDLLLRLEENVNLNFKQVKDAIKELNDGTTSKLEDHEGRIRQSETSITQVKTFGTALVIAVGIIETIILKFFH